jgi:hypothetical protein
MEKSIQNIELINNFLNKKLSESESKDFENRLKNESNFKKLYEEHIVLLEGIKRQTLKNEIGKGKQSYLRNKWFRYLGFTLPILIVMVSVLVHMSPENSKTKELPNEIKNSKLVLDSVISDNNFEEKRTSSDTLKPEKIEQKKQKIINKIKLKKEIVKIEIPEKLSQTFTINLAKDTIITCNEGTKLTIKANAFLDEENKTVKGKINLKVTEYYKLSDMLLANLSTSSNGKQLETGGMLFIEAKKGELDLKLKENSSIEISFPTKNKKEDMQLFSGLWENDIINWQLETTQEEQIEIVEVEEDVDVPFSVIEDVPIYPGCENLDKKSTRNCTSKSIQEFVQRNFNTEIAEAIGLTGRQRVNVIFKINKYGDVVSIRTSANYPILNEEAERVIALLPKMIPGKQRGKSVTVPYSLPIIFQLDGVSNSISVGSSSPSSKVLGDSVVAKKLEAILVDEKSPRLSAAVVSSYILTTAKLGWINCDRFIKSRSSLKYKLINKSTDGSVKVNMVFKSIKSVLPSTNLNGIFDFGTVPKDAKVTLIAIKKGNGKLYLSIIDTKTEENPDIEFKFKEVSLEELKSELIKLNNRIKF